MGSEGDIFYDGINGLWEGVAGTDNIGPGLNDDFIGRINQALNDAGWPATLRSIFSGNVALQEVVYQRNSSLLQVILDAADAEFPGVANVYVDKNGKVTFRGRFARFDPTNPQYGITFWPCGDTAACADTTYAPIFGLDFSRGKSNLINSAIALPETGLYSAYYVDNYKDPRNRVNQIRFRPVATTHPNATALWGTVCGVEIGDVISLKCTFPWGGGFDEDFYVEGIHYDAVPLNATMPDINLTLDLSPAAYYAIPFGG